MNTSGEHLEHSREVLAQKKLLNAARKSFSHKGSLYFIYIIFIYFLITAKKKKKEEMREKTIIIILHYITLKGNRSEHADPSVRMTKDKMTAMWRQGNLC